MLGSAMWRRARSKSTANHPGAKEVGRIFLSSPYLSYLGKSLVGGSGRRNRYL